MNSPKQPVRPVGQTKPAPALIPPQWRSREEIIDEAQRSLRVSQNYDGHVTSYSLLKLLLEVALNCRDLLALIDHENREKKKQRCRLCGIETSSTFWPLLCAQNGGKGHEL